MAQVPAFDFTGQQLRDHLLEVSVEAGSVINAVSLGSSPLAVSVDTTYAEIVEIPEGFQFVVAAGVTLHFSKGYITGDRNRCFDITAAGSSVTGDAAPSGYVTPYHFGADPSNVAHDDMPAIEAATEYATLDAIRDEYATSFDVRYPFPGEGNFYKTLTRPIYYMRTARHYGMLSSFSRQHSGIEIRAADGLDAVAAAWGPLSQFAPEYRPANATDDPTTPGIGKNYSAIRSVFEDLTFLPMAGATVRQGFVHNTVCFLTRCRGGGFTEAVFHAHAQTSGAVVNMFAHPGVGNTGNTDPLVAASTIDYSGGGAVWGNTNGSRYESCYALNNVAANGVNGGAHGFVAHGNNSGTITYFKCDGSVNKGVGFLENCTISCEYICNHTAGNCFDVDHNGARYVCIKYHTSDAASEPGVGANWRTYWLENTSGTGDTTWALSEDYHPTCGVNISTSANQSTIVGHYTEGGIEVGVIARSGTSVLGGNAVDRTPWHGEFGSAFVAKSRTHSSLGFEGRRDPGDAATKYGASLGALNGYTGGRLLQVGDSADDAARPTSALYFGYQLVRKIFAWHDASNSNRLVSGITGLSFLTGITQRFFFANGMLLANGSLAPSEDDCVRIRSVDNFLAITDESFGPARNGDIWYYNRHVSGGKIGAVCTTEGTIGAGAVIKEFGSIDI